MIPLQSRFRSAAIGAVAHRRLLAGRRQFLTTAAVGTMALTPALAACGTDDAATLSSDTTVAAATESGTDETTADTTDETEATTSTEAVTSESSESTVAVSGDVVPDSAELAVSFTYAASDSGDRIRNPYIAVWIEDTDGNLVDTVAVWYLQDSKGTKWLDDLRLWYSVSNSAEDVSMSGATRSPGSYDLVWDGTDLDGNAVAQGEYVLYIESAREHGPYSVTSATLTLGESGVSVDLADNNELSGATAIYSV